MEEENKALKNIIKRYEISTKLDYIKIEALKIENKKLKEDYDKLKNDISRGLTFNLYNK